MKIIRKIATLVGSALMIGSTIGMAAAANFPAPFVSGGAADVGLVIPSSTDAALSDSVAASNIAVKLSAVLTTQTATTETTTTAVSGGDSVKIEKTSTKFHLGNGVLDVRSTSITDDDMPNLLIDGEYIDSANEEFDYTQKIKMANLSLAMFDDNDYLRDAPTVGFRIDSGDNVLNYTLDFSDEPLLANLVSTDLTFMGKTYYVLSKSNSGANIILTLLDSAETAEVAEGETATVAVNGKSYEVSIYHIGTDEVKLVINGETTNLLAGLETQKLVDDAYVGIKDVMYTAKTGAISKVEFSIGAGKLKLTSGSDIELNDDSIDSLSVTITNTTTKLSSIKIIWGAEDELFVAEDTEVTMPGFEAIKLSYTGMVYPKEEEILIENDGDESIVLENFPLKGSTEDINILYWGGDYFSLIGKDADEVLLTSNATYVVFDKNTDEWFVVSWSDSYDSESYLMRATGFKTEDNINKTTIEYRKNGAWVEKKSEAEPTNEITLGSVELTIGYIDKLAKTVNISTTNANVNFNTLYSKEGMKVYLPYIHLNATGVGGLNTTGDATFDLVISEEDKNENIGLGANFTVTLAERADDEVHVSSIAITGSSGTASEIGDTDVYRNFAYSQLATEMLYSKPSGEQKTLKLVYHGDESYGGFFVNSPETTVVATTTTGTGVELGMVTYYDNEADSFAGKNLIVVGGSCINTVAAELLGSAACGADFTSLTGVAAGEFLLQSFDKGGKVALLVAGYHAEDTTKAATYLVNNVVDTSVGKKYKGTSVTEASLVVE